MTHRWSADGMYLGDLPDDLTDEQLDEIEAQVRANAAANADALKRAGLTFNSW